MYWQLHYAVVRTSLTLRFETGSYNLSYEANHGSQKHYTHIHLTVIFMYLNVVDIRYYKFNYLIYYLHKVNKVNGGDNVFVLCGFCVSVCVFASGPVNQTSLKWELNANSSKRVKATDLKFDTRVPRDSTDMTAQICPKGGVARVTWPPKFFGIKC